MKAQWRVIDSPNPQRLHLMSKSPRPLRVPVGGEQALPKCEVCLRWVPRAR